MDPLSYYKQIANALGVGGPNTPAGPIQRLQQSDMNLVRSMQGMPAPGPGAAPLTSIRTEDVDFIRQQRGLPPTGQPKMGGLSTLSNDDIDFLRNAGNMRNARAGEVKFANSQDGSPFAGGALNLGNEQRFNPTAPTMPPNPINQPEGTPFGASTTEGSPFVGSPFPQGQEQRFPPMPPAPPTGMEQRFRPMPQQPGPGQLQLSPANGGGVAPIPMPPTRPQGPATAYTMDPGDGGIVRTFMSPDGKLPEVPGMNVQALDYMPKGFLSGLLG